VTQDKKELRNQFFSKLPIQKQALRVLFGESSKYKHTFKYS